ncbi:Sec-independent protein translocase subunit TatA [Streptomyces sp. PU-14G]|uniref:Sec-independent protein translocase subunit TatA n=1 Tax=Streptomyces sp. PU-14G TaxID=2800808 RepID=UPI0034E015CD
MFLRNGLEPWHLLVVALVTLLVFGSKRLPDTARSVGKSLRILRSETRALRQEDIGRPTPAHSSAGDAPSADGAPSAQEAPSEGAPPDAEKPLAARG